MPFRSFHHLADEKAHHRFLARAILLDLLGIGRDDFVDDLFDSGGIADLLRLLFLVNFAEVLVALRKLRSYNSLSILPEIAPLSTRSADNATPFIEIGDCSISRPFAFRRPISSLCTRFATRLGFFAALAAASN